MLNKYLIYDMALIRDCLKKMQINGQRCVIVVDSLRRVKGTFSDGDVRRLILNNISINNKLKKNYYKKNFFCIYKKNYSTKKIKNLFLKKNITLIPILDEKNKVVEVETWSNFFNKNLIKQIKKTSVVITAGGKGTRLEPYTSILPKPLMPIKNIPMIEYVITNFKKYNYKKFIFTTNYKSNLIKTYFQDKFSDFSIDYVEEKKPLGTAGGLKNINNLSDDFFLINCDTLIEINYDKLLKYHKLKNSDLTIVTCKKKSKSSYGVCNIDSKKRLINFKEKPEKNFLINTGFYVLNKKILNLMSKNIYYDFDTIIKKALNQKLNIQTYEINKKNWSDLGKISGLKKD